MRYLTVLFLLVLVSTSCQPSKKVDEEKVVSLKALKDEVFELHDEVMPMMGDLRRVRKSLMLQVDSIQEINAEKGATLTGVADELNAANEGMMVWMRNFDPNFDGSDEEVLKYLTAQKSSIEEVNRNMKETLKKGQELLDSN
ncbi:MAG: hypothetical protein ABJP45_02460 [Cyclobacteriaceae bacterium]